MWQDVTKIKRIIYSPGEGKVRTMKKLLKLFAVRLVNLLYKDICADMGFMA